MSYTDLPHTELETLPPTFFRVRTRKVKHASRYRDGLFVDVFHAGMEPSIEVVFAYKLRLYSLVGNGASYTVFPRVGEIVVASMWSILPVVWSDELKQYVSLEGPEVFDFPCTISCVEWGALREHKKSLYTQKHARRLQSL